MHNHKLVQSSKKNICYCINCQNLSYKGALCQSFLINPLNFNLDPFELKFMPFSPENNNKMESHTKYLEYRKTGILKIYHLINAFSIKSIIYYKAIGLMDHIYLKNDVSIDDIETIASICVLLAIKFNECYKPYIKEDNLTKNENYVYFLSHVENNGKISKNVTNIKGLFHYISKNVNNFKYWEILCLKYLNYDLRRYSAYDYLILFFQLGIFFCKETIDIMSKFKICLKILNSIINNSKSSYYSQYILAMSIIKVAFETEIFFNIKIFKEVYEVDLSKKKYKECSNYIKIILNFENILDNYSQNYQYNTFLRNIYFFKYFNNYSNDEKSDENKNTKNKKINRKRVYNNNINNIIMFNSNIEEYIFSKLNSNNKNNRIIINNNFINNNINVNNYNFYSKYLKNNSNNYYVNNVVKYENKIITFQ